MPLVSGLMVVVFGYRCDYRVGIFHDSRLELPGNLLHIPASSILWLMVAYTWSILPTWLFKSRIARDHIFQYILSMQLERM